MLYKKCEAKLHVKYVIMVCVLLHNLCIARNDPCNPRWELHVDELGIIAGNVHRRENKEESRQIANKISDWLWLHG